ncbi:MAG TPA: ATP-binding protein [Paludibacter sp.]|nr:ATP-binding protein [Paludibacter sp.]
MLKIAILGPESTGKTELAKRLSEYFNAPWVPEYAREYIGNLDCPYTYDDVCQIAEVQIEQENNYNSGTTESDFVFFDTDLIITKVWFEYKYGKIPDFLANRMETCYFDFYILCEDDLPWQPDPLREHGTDRKYFFDWYKNEIEQTNKPYVIVNGFGEQRVQNAIQAISTLKHESDSLP